MRNSVLGRYVKVHSGALIEGSTVFDDCDIGRRAKIRGAILDKNVRVPEDAVIGYDPELDRKHYHVTESGIVVVVRRALPRGAFDADGVSACNACLRTPSGP